ncbi:MAG: DotA/TraY family protein, partial [Giesbergeria sp.]
PSLPYTIFIVAVVGWLLAVLQTVFAAPLWAVMHMTPDRTFVGSQTQGYLMFLSLFMRPVLIIAALFAAMLLANPIVLYVSKAFWAMRTANVSSAESLGFFVQFLTWKNWMIMYGLMLGPIVYMIFGLTNTLPDAILTWIGAGIKPLGETQATAEMRSGMERHGASARGAALGGAAGARRLPPAGSGSAGRSGGAMPSGGSGLGYAGAAAGGAAAGAAYAGGAGSDANRAHRPISDTGQSKGHDTPDYVPPEQSPATSGSRAAGAGAAGVAAGAAAQNYSSGQDRLVNNESSTTSARADDATSGGTDANGNRPLSNEAASTAGVGAVLNSDTAEPSGTSEDHMFDDNQSNRSAAA